MWGPSITRKQLEDWMLAYKPVPSGAKMTAVEHATFPPMVATFMRLTRDNHMLPPYQDVFINALMPDIRRSYPTLPVDGVVGRLNRAYMPFVNQYHAAVSLREVLTPVAFWHPEIDQRGTDISVNYKGHSISVCLYTSTARAEERYEYKATKPNSLEKHYTHHVTATMYPGPHNVGTWWTCNINSLINAILYAVGESGSEAA